MFNGAPRRYTLLRPGRSISGAHERPSRRADVELSRFDRQCWARLRAMARSAGHFCGAAADVFSMAALSGGRAQPGYSVNSTTNPAARRASFDLLPPAREPEQRARRWRRCSRSPKLRYHAATPRVAIGLFVDDCGPQDRRSD